MTNHRRRTIAYPINWNSYQELSSSSAARELLLPQPLLQLMFATFLCPLQGRASQTVGFTAKEQRASRGEYNSVVEAGLLGDYLHDLFSLFKETLS